MQGLSDNEHRKFELRFLKLKLNFRNEFQIYPHSLHDPLAVIAYDDPKDRLFFSFFEIHVGARNDTERERDCGLSISSTTSQSSRAKSAADVI